MPKDLAYYLSLNYPIEVIRDEGLFLATHPDLPGCVAQGDTADEAIASLDDAREAWIAVGLEDNRFIPEPLPEEFSGRLSLRMPRALHAALAREAQRQRVSLSQFIITALAGSVGLGKGLETTSEISELTQLAKDLKALLAKLTTTAGSSSSFGSPRMSHQDIKPSMLTTGFESALDISLLSGVNLGKRVEA